MREKIPFWFGLCSLPNSESGLETVRVRVPSACPAIALATADVNPWNLKNCF